MKANKIYTGNCIDRLKEIANNSVDLVYMDPPFKGFFYFWVVSRTKPAPSQ